MYSQSEHKISGKNARALVSTCTCMLIFWRLNLRCAIRTYFQADRNFSLLICRLGYPLFHQHGTTHFRNLLQSLRKWHTQYLALTSVYTLHFLQIFFSNVICTYLGSIQYNPVCEENYALRYFFSMRCFRYLLGDAISSKMKVFVLQSRRPVATSRCLALCNLGQQQGLHDQDQRQEKLKR